jgi:hypothetical protein
MPPFAALGITMAKAHRGHMQRHRQNDWASVGYDARFDDYWVQAGGARQALFYCPWCGEKLPPSQRDRWFDELKARGIDPNVDPIPAEFRSGEWRGATQPHELGPERGGTVDGRYLNLFEIEPD